MKTALLDLNVLLALAWPSHEHHEAAHAWRDARPAGRWATCPLTQVGFVRLSCNPALVDPVAAPAQAAELLRRMMAQPGHVFWPDDLDLAVELRWPPAWVKGHGLVTDAHLVLLAERHRGRLVTFDRPLAAAAGAALVELLPH
jgi:hypothetical protein